MANIKSSKKRSIQSEKKRKYNSSKKSMIRSFIKKVKNSILKKEKDTINNSFIEMQSILDRYAKKNLIHKNKASRLKSRLSKKIKFIFK
ncbi:rpsT [Wigglesworthia glossinidia endosymbiont of Glossina brevipalpis]|uniref:Small ribosomal subunit protein bS20 n=1 Tax=Wigglesworthia glossinidia brevipalpis TaxID=36870 RepID=RS20_WIGBR|nr:RecName: Full=Small ribosomal subunit protein bS20; AltName: Full=30S ribosomal protein S20 [Wigglesworthia glossinidia endosymbiont of Glossina brevipalpis]BAC24442.1 rpsT [Wigglesworthia glossinidia endosymbiont of Glossina brevipalpis]